MKPWRDTKRKQCYFQLDSQSYSPNVHAASLAAQSCPTLRPYELFPTRLLCPWDSQARILEWVAMPSFGIHLLNLQ